LKVIISHTCGYCGEYVKATTGGFTGGSQPSGETVGKKKIAATIRRENNVE